MKLKALLIGGLVLIFLSSKAQLITYRGLSNKYVYKIGIIKKIDTNGINKESKISLFIFNKRDKLIQTIHFKEDLLFDTVFKDNKNVRSYVTGKNKDAEVSDYDFGDLVIADLNFDGREDIAVKYDSGGNSGPSYNFYMQDNSGRFWKDNYLTTYVASFPRYINRKNKTITTQIHATFDQEGRKTFKHNGKTRKWHLVKWVMVEAGDG